MAVSMLAATVALAIVAQDQLPLRAAPRESAQAQAVLFRASHHSAALELGERGIDLGDVQGWLGHKHVQTTRKHYAPVLNRGGWLAGGEDLTDCAVADRSLE